MRSCHILRLPKMTIWICMCRTVKNLCLWSYWYMGAALYTMTASPVRRSWCTAISAIMDMHVHPLTIVLPRKQPFRQVWKMWNQQSVFFVQMQRNMDTIRSVLQSGESQLEAIYLWSVALPMMRNLIVFHLSEKMRTILFPVKCRWSWTITAVWNSEPWKMITGSLGSPKLSAGRPACGFRGQLKIPATKMWNLIGCARM